MGWWPFKRRKKALIDDPHIKGTRVWLTDLRELCELYFDNVQIPKENLIGELNAGWTIAKKLLQHERAFISNFGLAGAAAAGGVPRSPHRAARQHCASQPRTCKS